MRATRLGAVARMSVRPQARIKLARILGMPESVFASSIQEIEAHPLFHRLAEAGALSIQPLPGARYAPRAFEGRQLRASGDGLGDLLDGKGEIADLMRRVGREAFEENFLGDAPASDARRARACGISEPEARTLREFVDRLYVREEFAAGADRAAPATVYSSVARIELENGRPTLAFFNREIWKGRYLLDGPRCRAFKASLPPAEAARVDRFLRRLDLLSFRRTTLYRVLELLIAEQAAYLAGGDPAERRPLTQRAVAARLNVTPSVLCQLVSNKSVETPWRLEIPLKTLLPSRKAMMRDRLYDLAMERPEAADEALRDAMLRLYGARLSRPSIIQYRKELGLGGRGRRGVGVGA